MYVCLVLTLLINQKLSYFQHRTASRLSCKDIDWLGDRVTNDLLTFYAGL